MDKKPYTIKYEFYFPNNNAKKIFTISLDPQTITFIRKRLAVLPDWTLLESNQCRCCPLTKEKYPHCPIAINIVGLVEEFKNYPSSDSCDISCKTPERTYLKTTSVQEGLFSILGIIMATSDCPVMGFFKPMARFHLPFSTIQETVVRSASIYMLRQYFENKKGKTPDLKLEALDEHYAKVQEVNRGILLRIKSIAESNIDKNAIVILNSLAQLFSYEIDDGLKSIEYLFYS